MFDKKPNDHEKGDSINLLPIEMQKDTSQGAKKHFTLGNLHVPSKEVKHKNIEASLPHHANRGPALPRPSFFSRLSTLFKKRSKNKKEASITAMNVVAPSPKIVVVPAPLPPPQPRAPLAAPKNIPPTKTVKLPEKKELTGFNDVKDENKNNLEPGLEVNLLPATPKGFTYNQIVWSYFFIFVISALIIFSPYIFFRSKNSRYNLDVELLKEKLLLVDKKIPELEAEIKDYGILSQQFNNLASIFDGHIYWSQFFPTLENHTAGNVYFTDLSVSELGEISLNGFALDLRALAEELVVLGSSPVYEDAKLQALSFLEPKNPGDPAISFGLGFILPPSVIANQDQTIAKTPTQ